MREVLHRRWVVVRKRSRDIRFDAAIAICRSSIAARGKGVARSLDRIPKNPG
jgi:hypothetical protein